MEAGRSAADIPQRAQEPPVAGVDEAAQGGVELQEILLEHERRGCDVLRAIRRRGRIAKGREGDDEDGEGRRHQHGEEGARKRDPHHERDAHAKGANDGQAANPIEAIRVRLFELDVRHWAHALTRDPVRLSSAR